ncbi:cation:proton antiporter [Marinicella litoralis]|nr:cation:proton antiporter [Marinicella litoralis]
MDPALPMVVMFALITLSLGLLMKLLKQPTIVAYILAGILLGPHVLGWVTDQVLITRMGEFGVVMLLFFIGMEVVPEKLMASWKVSILGTLAQIILSVILIAAVGYYYQWSFSRILLVGFIISLSSTAVVLNLFQQSKEIETQTGQTVLGILLTQDLFVVLMIITLGFFSTEPSSTSQIIGQIIGAIVMVGFAAFIIAKKSLHLPWAKYLKTDHDLQVFAALLSCFGFALLSSYFNLSTALGAFLGGMLIGRAKETRWVHSSLEPFRVVFVALFFMSLGLMVNIDFIQQNLYVVLLVALLVLFSNLLINAGIIMAANRSWKQSLYAGSVLAPVGEFSFVLAAIGFQIHALTDYGYQLIIAVIVLTLLISPLLIGFAKKWLMEQSKH